MDTVGPNERGGDTISSLESKLQDMENILKQFEVIKNDDVNLENSPAVGDLQCLGLEENSVDGRHLEKSDDFVCIDSEGGEIEVIAVESADDLTLVTNNVGDSDSRNGAETARKESSCSDLESDRVELKAEGLHDMKLVGAEKGTGPGGEDANVRSRSSLERIDESGVEKCKADGNSTSSVGCQTLESLADPLKSKCTQTEKLADTDKGGESNQESVEVKNKKNLSWTNETEVANTFASEKITMSVGNQTSDSLKLPLESKNTQTEESAGTEEVLAPVEKCKANGNSASSVGCQTLESLADPLKSKSTQTEKLADTDKGGESNQESSSELLEVKNQNTLSRRNETEVENTLASEKITMSVGNQTSDSLKPPLESKNTQTEESAGTDEVLAPVGENNQESSSELEEAKMKNTLSKTEEAGVVNSLANEGGLMSAGNQTSESLKPPLESKGSTQSENLACIDMVVEPNSASIDKQESNSTRNENKVEKRISKVATPDVSHEDRREIGTELHKKNIESRTNENEVLDSAENKNILSGNKNQTSNPLLVPIASQGAQTEILAGKDNRILLNSVLDGNYTKSGVETRGNTKITLQSTITETSNTNSNENPKGSAGLFASNDVHRRNVHSKLSEKIEGGLDALQILQQIKSSSVNDVRNIKSKDIHNGNAAYSNLPKDTATNSKIYPLVRSSHRSAFKNTANDRRNLTSDTQLKTLEQALDKFGLLPDLEQLENSLEEVRRRKKTPEEHEAQYKRLDKELQNLSRTYHPDSVMKRGGSMEEVEHAKELQTALNASRTVLRTLNKIFLEDIDVEHRYAFFAKLDIGLLGNEDEVENHAYDVLFKISLVSDIKQESVVAEIRRFLVSGERCLESYLQRDSCANFIEYRGAVFYHLERCITGYEKLQAELEDVESECRVEKLYNISPLISRMKRDCSKQLRHLEDLLELSRRPFGELRLLSCPPDVDEYFVLPLDSYVNVIMACSAMIDGVEGNKGWLNDLLKCELPSFLKKNRAHKRKFYDDDVDADYVFRSGRQTESRTADDGISLLYLMASCYRGGNREHKRALKERLGVLFVDREDLKENFLVQLVVVSNDLKKQFRSENYVEGGTKKHILKELRECREMKAEFEQRKAELLSCVREIERNNQYMKKKLEKLTSDNSQVSSELDKYLADAKMFKEKIKKFSDKQTGESNGELNLKRKSSVKEL